MGKSTAGVDGAAGRSSRLSDYQAISYAAPVIASSMLFAPIAIIQGIYAKHYGIALSTLAWIVLASRIFDAVSDPVIGYLSDRHRARHGSRKPFILVGGLSLLLCSYFLYVPQEQVSAGYAAVWFIAFYMAITLFEIPHITWPCDIGGESVDKTRLYSYRIVAAYGGLVLFYCIPLLPVFPSKEITPQTLEITFYVAAGLALPFLFQAMRAVPAGSPAAPVASPQRPSWALLRAALFEFVHNTPFLLFVGAFLFGSFSVGMWYGLIYIYVDAYLGMGDQFAQLFLMAFIVGIAVVPLWYWVALKIGKKPAFITAELLLIGSFIYTGMLKPGETSFEALLLLKVVQTCAFVGGGIVVPAMLAEVIDYAHWKTGVEKSATYFAVKVFFEKTTGALGAGLALAMAGWFGFVVTDSQFSPESIRGLKIAIAWGPTALALIALVFMILMPINERRHGIIKRRLDARLARSQANSQTIPDSNRETINKGIGSHLKEANQHVS